jgi:hypothetical protein
VTAPVFCWDGEAPPPACREAHPYTPRYQRRNEVRIPIIVTIALVSGAAAMGAIVVYARSNLKNVYLADVAEGIRRTRSRQPEPITDADLAHLPDLVRDYLVSVGVVGKPKVYSMRATFEAQMRSKTRDWFSLTAEQYNFFDTKERLFYLDAKVNGLPTRGYHRYKEGTARMLIKLLGLFPVVDMKGDTMFKAETVTMFNDMCFLAPATLIDQSITWEEIDSSSVRATFANLSSTISATLHFNEAGRLVNFVSDDRYDVSEGKRYRFSTPLSEFGDIGGYTLPTYGEAIWHYPDGKFVYGKYRLKSVEYNVRECTSCP